ncbi:MAG: hypothetical protein K9M36_01000 [Candidatus Pacebacteria bacterium]|nr:hypothetical protein [Candidatus Paceibacterota bacterium]
MADKQVLRSKILTQVVDLIKKLEKEKGNDKINELLRILRSSHQNLLKKTGNFVSPKIDKQVQNYRTEVNRIVDPL